MLKYYPDQPIYWFSKRCCKYCLDLLLPTNIHWLGWIWRKSVWTQPGTVSPQQGWNRLQQHLRWHNILNCRLLALIDKIPGPRGVQGTVHGWGRRALLANEVASNDRQRKEDNHHQCRRRPHCHHQNYKKKGVYPVYPVTSFLLDPFHGIMKLLQWPNVPFTSIYSLDEERLLHKVCATTRGFTCQRIYEDHLSMDGVGQAVQLFFNDSTAPERPKLQPSTLSKAIAPCGLWARGPCLEPPTADCLCQCTCV